MPARVAAPPSHAVAEAPIAAAAGVVAARPQSARADAEVRRQTWARTGRAAVVDGREGVALSALCAQLRAADLAVPFYLAELARVAAVGEQAPSREESITGADIRSVLSPNAGAGRDNVIFRKLGAPAPTFASPKMEAGVAREREAAEALQ